MPVTLASVDFPKRPGVYLFKTNKGRVLYVGKATKLNERIRSYFAQTPDRQMIPELVRRSDDIECIVTNSPEEALILERQLIRQHKPRYNSMLKDDKSYPFLVLTKEEIPRIMYTRHPPKGSLRWGPFPNAGAAKQVMQLLRRQFGIRDCKELLPQGCLSMHIGLCAGPCIDATGYAERVNTARRILNGDAVALLEELASEMDAASEAMRFEQAAARRDTIRAVRATTGQHVVSSKVYRDCDAIGIVAQGEMAAVVIMHADQGVVKGQEVWPMVHRGDLGETVANFVAEHYANRRPPRLLLTPTPLLDGVEEWLCSRREAKVEVRTPLRGDLVTLLTLARQNADIQMTRLANATSGSLEQRAANEGAAVLGMEQLNHIVCFDMAQLLGDERVGASVTLRNGRPAKKEYRTYIVKTDAMDDLRMMREVVERWLKRQDTWPDLLLIDGGETHLSTISALLEEHGVLGEFGLAALAKREETIYRNGLEPIVLDRKGRVMVHARDEAHRFVNTYHRKRRGKSRMADPLQDVEGLGAKKMQNLLRHFGGRQGIQHASADNLTTVPGIGPALAQRIYDALHN
ncbi:MAG: excinuclease ABC subunit UvrC [Euryarchaeota archaeon]|jgi:excinuclease ABC subunit C|nr:excinuclease ABC subunit UvrC [Euryarchaeota archaeon]